MGAQKIEWLPLTKVIISIIIVAYQITNQSSIHQAVIHQHWCLKSSSYGLLKQPGCYKLQVLLPKSKQHTDKNDD